MRIHTSPMRLRSAVAAPSGGRARLYLPWIRERATAPRGGPHSTNTCWTLLFAYTVSDTLDNMSFLGALPTSCNGSRGAFGRSDHMDGCGRTKRTRILC